MNFEKSLANIIRWKQLNENPIGRVVIHIYCSSVVFTNTVNRNLQSVTLHVSTIIVFTRIPELAKDQQLFFFLSNATTCPLWTSWSSLLGMAGV